MNSNDADEKARQLQHARAKRNLLKIRFYRVAPWALWIFCLLAAIYFGRGLTGLGVSPGVAMARAVSVTSPNTLSVERVLVQPGDVVKKGQVLVELNTQTIDLELAIAERELQRVELEVGARVGSLKRGDLVTRERLSSDAERAALDVARIDSQIARDRAELEQLSLQIERQQKLVEERLARADTLDGLQLRKAALAEEVREGETLVRRAREHRSASKARVADFNQQLNEYAKGNPEIAPFQAATLLQKERISKMKSMRDALAVKATKPGVVSAIFCEEGGAVAAGSALLQIVDDTPKQVQAYVDEKIARRVKINDSAILTPSDRASVALKGKVMRLAPTVSLIPQRFRVIPAEESFGRVVYIAIEDDSQGVLAGQAFDVTFGGAR